MIVDCPHCSAPFLVEEEQLALGSKLQARCKLCQSGFVIKSPAELPRSGVQQTVILAAVAGPARGQVFRLNQARTVLGRSGADIVLYDPEVSREHCIIELYGSIARLIDLDTTNGTFVDGKRVDNCELRHLSKFQIGATTLLFTISNNASDDSVSPATVIGFSRRQTPARNSSGALGTDEPFTNSPFLGLRK
jgi:predicted Zn finger-like uncharacterized protein